MKSLKNSFVKFIVATSCIFVLAGCGETNNIASVVFNDNYQSEWKVGEIDFSTLFYTVTYKNGSTEQVPVTVDMIAEADLYKFYSPGEWKVNINFNEHYHSIVEFTIYENTFDETIKLENKVIAYDGKTHGLDLLGPIPEGTKIYYPLGNSFTNYSVEPYEIKCILSKDGYKTKELSGRLTITQADYPKEILDQITFEDAEYTYDGTEKSVVAKNVPSDCTIEYFIDKNRGNSKVNAGVYKVVGVISCTNYNYFQIPNIEATLTINKAQYDLSQISFDDKVVVFKQGSQQTITVTNADLLPSNVRIEYDNNTHEDVGTYTATARFICDPNYEEIDPMTATLTISPQVVDLSKIVIKKPQLVVYDGEVQDFEIEVPETVIVEKTYYTESGQKVVGTPKDVGNYRVKLDYKINPIYKADNYQLINVPEDEGLLIIQKKTLDLGKLDFGMQEYEFNNLPHQFIVETQEIDPETQMPVINTVPEELEIGKTYLLNGTAVEQPTNVGDYDVQFNINYKEIDSFGNPLNPNNFQIVNAPEKNGTLSITKIKIDLSKVIIGDQIGEYVDDSTNIEYKVKNVPENVLCEITYSKNGVDVTDTSQVGIYSVYVGFSLDETKVSSDNYELVNVPNGATSLSVQKKKIKTDGIEIEGYTTKATGSGIAFPDSNIKGTYDSIKEYVKPVYTYYYNGEQLTEGTLPKEKGVYAVDVKFELNDEYSSEKYVIWSSTGETEWSTYINLE